MNRVTVYLNGKWYWFDNVEELVELLERNCDDTGYADGAGDFIEFAEEV